MTRQLSEDCQEYVIDILDKLQEKLIFGRGRLGLQGSPEDSEEEARCQCLMKLLVRTGAGLVTPGSDLARNLITISGPKLRVKAALADTRTSHSFHPC